MNILELFDILLSDKPSDLIRANEEEVFEFIPELAKCKGFEQRTSWHKFDVYDHILCVIDNVDSDIMLRLAALFHDIGKPETFFLDENGVGHFPKHWEVSRRIFDEFALKNNIDKNLAKDVSALIYYHDVDFDKSPNILLDAVNDIGYDNISKLFNFKKADVLAQADEFQFKAKEYEKQEKKYSRSE
jgi:tRNA nucleotidyltransferase (CCA-adding enzyme)